MEIINQTTGEVVDINKMTNDQLASEYRNYQKESQFARTMMDGLKEEFVRRAEETGTEMLVAQDYEVRRAEKVKKWNVDRVRQLGEILDSDVMGQIITVPKPEPKVNGTKLRAAAMKYKGVVAKAYEEAKEEVDHYWTVKQTRKQYK